MGRADLIQWRDAGKWLEMRSENSKNELNSGYNYREATCDLRSVNSCSW